MNRYKYTNNYLEPKWGEIEAIDLGAARFELECRWGCVFGGGIVVLDDNDAERGYYHNSRDEWLKIEKVSDEIYMEDIFTQGFPYTWDKAPYHTHMMYWFQWRR